MAEAFLSSVESRSGHFKTESGHHTDSWMDLATLCRRPRSVQPLAVRLASRLRAYQLDAVCGPLNEGAFIALMVAAELGCDFTYAERLADPISDGLFPVSYSLPLPLRPFVAQKRVAIVNDVISAGSAIRGAFADLSAVGGQVVVIASLLVLGDSITVFGAERGVPIESLARSPYRLWTPADCPLCKRGVPLESIA